MLVSFVLVGGVVAFVGCLVEEVCTWLVVFFSGRWGRFKRIHGMHVWCELYLVHVLAVCKQYVRSIRQKNTAFLHVLAVCKQYVSSIYGQNTAFLHVLAVCKQYVSSM